MVVVDVVALEATHDRSKPYAAEIAAWIAEGGKPGSNRPVEIATTELGPLYRLALDQNIKPPRNAGEIGITQWLTDELRHIGGPALVVYENGKIPNMLAREGIAEPVALATTRNLLELAEREELISSAETLWTRILHVAPTANPASVLTYINPAKSMTELASVHPAICRYSAGEISAANAADSLGGGATVADVFVMTRLAGLALPRPPREQEQAELAHAIRVLEAQ